jgi:F-type H+-transporting ATPase subunit b
VKAAWLVFLAGSALWAQHAEQTHEKQGAAAEHGAEHSGDPNIWWKWANFAILAGALGYMIGKRAGPFFTERSASIQKDIREATRLREEAEARAAEMERRASNLEVEIAELRALARQEMAAESDRLRQQTEQQMAKREAGVKQEIASAEKAARQQLRAYSAELAVELAEHKIRARITPQADDVLVRSFVAGLDHRGPEA